MNETVSDELKRLRAENARLRALLAQRGIAVDEPENMSPRKPALSLEEKVALFCSLFQGREDVFARRWFSNSTGKSGYQPVCSRLRLRELCRYAVYAVGELTRKHLKSVRINFCPKHYLLTVHRGLYLTDCDISFLYRILNAFF